jgi:hypothetical protein
LISGCEKWSPCLTVRIEQPRRVGKILEMTRSQLEMFMYMPWPKSVDARENKDRSSSSVLLELANLSHFSRQKLKNEF